MKKLVRFSYLYRDCGNYKSRNAVDFTNPEHLSIDEIDKRLRSCFDQQCYFIAHQIDIPEVFMYADDPVTEDDHCFHEYDSVKEIEQKDLANPSRTINDFLTVVQTNAAQGWKAFDPLEHLSRIQAYGS
ncbi:MAG: hypothetical protein HGA62_06840 [Chlorobiaceae bacterium]|nr:hypothetical protein [Chlorobiaceae bacterium]NTV61858.1 hypothetical protein [Chlorobiaceae bacterium]